MRWTSVVAIYLLFWVLSAFLVLPFGVRTPDELGVEKVPGQADSAPANFSPGRILRRATVVSVAGFALYYVCYTHHWISVDDFDVGKWLGWY